MKHIEKNKHYINSGNIFSKSILIQDYISKNIGPVLLFVPEEEKITAYKKITEYLQIPFEKLQNFSQLIELRYNQQGYFLSDLNLFEVEFPKNDYENKKHYFTLNKGDKRDIDEITQMLHDFGYKHSKLSSKTSFCVQGDTLALINFSGNREYRISFWDDIIEDICIIDTLDQKTQSVETMSIGKIKDFSEFLHTGKMDKNIPEYISKSCNILDELDFSHISNDILSYSKHFISFHHFSQSHERKEENLGIQDLFLENIDDLKKILNNSHFIKKEIFTKNITVLKNFIEYNNLENITLKETKVNNLKSFQTHNTCVICDDNISRIFIKKRVQKSMSKKLDLLLQIKPGDYIVHVDHGIGVFEQIIEKELQISPIKKIRKEYIELQYKNNDKLFIPITEVGRINKYVGVENPKLTGLSTKEWEKKLKKINENVEEIAHELLDAYAKRSLQKGEIFPAQPQEEIKFFHSFPFTYTSDQMDIIRDIYTDMESDKPMDRLVAGDVGFGKTEIAFAAIYKAIISGKQAALISPLVVLTYEHYEKAKKRFSQFPFNIAIVTRFETKKSVDQTLKDLKEGKIDLIIGTHRLLSTDIVFKSLGVLVIDEEHKFGVKDKDNITKIKENIEVLSLSATPIPRSLNMALNGIKTMSILNTPPVGRKSIETVVSKYDEHVIREAGNREFERNGQLFFIHNKVATIESFRDQLGIIFPKKKIIIAHGQLHGDQLEKRIISFKKKEYDILLATTVIENGIDFPNVNTIFINDAYNFGISQIHQLRGRVGRSDRQGYCYLLFNKDKIKEDAAKRLKTIVDYSHLGSGFELAIKDLEIRGGGDILGIKQSGQSTEVGINLYLEMLENKIDEIKRTGLKDNGTESEKNVKKIETSIDINIGAFIDNNLFHSELDKINFYREIENLDTLEELENIIQDFKEVNEHISQETQNFFQLLELKFRAQDYKISSIKKVGVNYQIDFDESITLEEVKKILQKDSQVIFEVNSLQRLRGSVKKFPSEEKFLEYIKDILSNKKVLLKKKIKLKK